MVGLAGGSPYLLELTASIAYDLREGGTVSESAISGHALSEAWEYLEDLWGNAFSKPEKRVLLRVSEGKRPPRKLQYAVERLGHAGILGSINGELGFQEGLLGLYVSHAVGNSFLRRLFT